MRRRFFPQFFYNDRPNARALAASQLGDRARLALVAPGFSPAAYPGYPGITIQIC